MSVSQLEGNSIVVVPPGNMVMIQDASQTLMSTPIGSGIAVSLYDADTRTAAMLHIQQPTTNLNANNRNPFVYADTGLSATLQQLAAKGINLNRLIVKVVGGAMLAAPDKHLTKESTEGYLGRWNYSSVRRVLWKNKMFIAAEDVGGDYERTIEVTVAEGAVTIASQGQKRTL